jgi:hypothetical protein
VRGPAGSTFRVGWGPRLDPTPAELPAARLIGLVNRCLDGARSPYVVVWPVVASSVLLSGTPGIGSRRLAGGGPGSRSARVGAATIGKSWLACRAGVTAPPLYRITIPRSCHSCDTMSQDACG